MSGGHEEMLEVIRMLPDHLRDALWRVESARLEPLESSGLVVCGMGGSAIGGDLAAAALGPRLGKQLGVARVARTQHRAVGRRPDGQRVAAHDVELLAEPRAQRGGGEVASDRRSAHPADKEA